MRPATLAASASVAAARTAPRARCAVTLARNVRSGVRALTTLRATRRRGDACVPRGGGARAVTNPVRPGPTEQA
ncbi:unnamed protein product [Leptidea sinapis]|uniref:Uncharacterized protein n=1 Tax=Leptidea sinapis TaxID=189913 RepID=A0A5E4RA44_9NEOP|nr:unnamed protein product [Leptidea sinapis]